MTSTPPKVAKPEHGIATRVAWIGFFGAVLAAVITIFPDLRPSGFDRLLNRLADLTAAINGQVITIGPGGNIAHAEAAVPAGGRASIKNADDVPHRVEVPGEPAAGGAAAATKESVIAPGEILHLRFSGPGLYLVVCTSCQTTEIRVTVQEPGGPMLAEGDRPAEEVSEDRMPEAADEAEDDEPVPGPGSTGSTPAPWPRFTILPRPSAGASAAAPTLVSATAAPSPVEPTGPGPSATVDGVLQPAATAVTIAIRPSATPAVPRAVEATPEPGAGHPPDDPPATPGSAADPLEPAPPAYPQPPELRPAGPEPRICAQLVGKVPQEDLDAAMADPSRVGGWDQLVNPNLPESPANPRKHWLSLVDINKRYDRLYNGLRFKAGCP